jgi:hypothetical protein
LCSIIIIRNDSNSHRGVSTVDLCLANDELLHLDATCNVADISVGPDHLPLIASVGQSQRVELRNRRLWSQTDWFAFHEEVMDQLGQSFPPPMLHNDDIDDAVSTLWMWQRNVTSRWNRSNHDGHHGGPMSFDGHRKKCSTVSSSRLEWFGLRNVPLKRRRKALKDSGLCSRVRNILSFRNTTMDPLENALHFWKTNTSKAQTANNFPAALHRLA